MLSPSPMSPIFKSKEIHAKSNTCTSGLKALQGQQSIHYWKAALTYNFNQNVGLSMEYSNGLLPDTADPERKWSLGLATKF